MHTVDNHPNSNEVVRMKKPQIKYMHDELNHACGSQNQNRRTSRDSDVCFPKLESRYRCWSELRGPSLPKILYKIVQSLKSGEDCKIVTKDCNFA